MNKQSYEQNAVWQDYEALDGQLERVVGLQPVDEEELSTIVKSLKSNKAPGHDCLKGIFLKKTFNSTKSFILKIINACLKISYFPDLWKKGNLVILLKNPAGDTTNVKNYRPITLLPEYGKVLEKIVRTRLYNHLTPAHSDLQFGFVPGLSTIDALGRLVNGIKHSEGTYQLVVFIDISGAFDNLWWPSLFLELRKRELPDTLVKLLKSYVTNRSVKYANGNVTVEKVITKGCPQGSVLGPSLWNIQLDNLLSKNFSDKVNLTAYADDLAVHVVSDSRRELINIAQQSVDIIVNWAKHCKLNISTTKTKIMVINKSKRTHDRDIKVRIDGHAIELVSEFKYLGVILDPGLTFTKHINYICKKAVDITMALRRKVYLTWGLDVSTSLTTIYKCAIIPILAYGIEIWGHRMSIKENVRKILSMHGSFCRALVGAYRSVSVDAACVLACIPPLDLILTKRLIVSQYKKQNIANFKFINENINFATFENQNLLKLHLDNIIMEEWQHRWTFSEKGRVTFSFFPIVSCKMLIQLNFITTQIYTGHGPFASHLHRIGKRENSLCEHCETQVDGPLHRIYNCSNYVAARLPLLNEEFWPFFPNELPFILTPEICESFLKE